ncbi:META domain-containing protein [Streptomyces prunicolor]|jgi:heat shock protein HslJ|uniref:META domain-containing protein n=1 Tax=Streptomyces prunicolor TaxID=67348 RepID=A0ABU4FET2_9ACTN|nr:META domain-containing protein [Streptomyces prunicolor]MDV7219086.1 META domain-containing protein [Streptomyces prunicolor]
MDKQRFTLAVLTIVPLVVACGSEKATSGSGSGSGSGASSVAAQRPVTGVDWQVQSITVNGATKNVHGKPYLAFDAKTGKVGGHLGCNAVNATATVRAGHITLGRPSTTRMMCDASLMGTERALLGLFNGQVDYRVDQDTATLTSANGTIVHARADK